MLFFTHVNTAVKQLTSNKGKATLTMLGIIIGIGAVIFIMTTGEIAKNFLLNQITQFGTNVMEITPAGIISENDDISFTMDDITKIKQSAVLPELTQITGLYPLIKTLTYNGADHNVTLYSTTPEMFSINHFTASVGRLFSTQDLRNKARVIVIGEQFAKDLFGSTANAVNKLVKINGRSFTITGVIQDTPFGGGSFGSEIVYVPITTVQELMAPAKDRGKISFIMLEFANNTDATSFKNRLLYEVRRIKNLSEADADKITAVSRQQFLEIFNTILLGVQLFISAVAGISLLVGGIGIMNIMLVTVKERTKEIGLRKAIGANNRSILTQFLIEAVVLTTCGGLIGILFGLSLSLGVVEILKIVQPTWGVHFVFVPNALILACSVSVTIGIIFGLYPALKASRLHPIESLRYE
ncbi:MAG: ABC transporter permease [Patescibacteria group bacterium]|jgi:putative ABC transport system permease protein